MRERIMSPLFLISENCCFLNNISVCKTDTVERHTSYFNVYNFMKVVTLTYEYCSVYCNILMCKGRMIWQGPQYP